MSPVPCLGSTHLLFPEDERGDEEPPAFCHNCPESLDCLTQGFGEKYGMWGGFNQEQITQARINKQEPRDLWNTKHQSDT